MTRNYCRDEYEEERTGRDAARFGDNYGIDHRDRISNRFDDECDAAYARGYQREIRRREDEREEEHRQEEESRQHEQMRQQAEWRHEEQMEIEEREIAYQEKRECDEQGDLE